jgi:RNA polymerase sigma-70 factor (ECF subfamily)
MDDAKPNVEPWHAQCEALYREHGARLLRLCRLLLRSPQEAEDVIQDVFLKLVERGGGPDRAMAWGPWLTRVTINACRDRQRAAWWHLWDRTAEEIELVDRGPTPEADALAGETRGRIWRAFRQLSQRQREVFVLRHLEAWPTQDAAEALGLSTGSVKRHLFRAIARLRETLGEES